MPRPKRKRISLWVVIGLAILSGAFVVRGVLTRSRHKELPANSFFEVKRGNLMISVTEEGSLRALNETVVRSTLDGYNRIIYLIPEGAMVKKGDLLIELDSSTVRTALNEQELIYQDKLFFLLQAKENVRIQESLAESQIKELEVAVENARDALEKYEEGDAPLLIKTAEARIAVLKEQVRVASERFERTEVLFKNGNSTKSEVEADSLTLKRERLGLEQYQEDLRLIQKYDHPNKLRLLASGVVQAEDELARLRLRITNETAQVEADLRTSQKTLEVLEDSLDQQRDRLSSSKIFAPQDGIVVYAISNPFQDRGDFARDEGRARFRDAAMRLGGGGQMGGFQGGGNGRRGRGRGGGGGGGGALGDIGSGGGGNRGSGGGSSISLASSTTGSGSSGISAGGGNAANSGGTANQAAGAGSTQGGASTGSAGGGSGGGGQRSGSGGSGSSSSPSFTSFPSLRQGVFSSANTSGGNGSSGGGASAGGASSANSSGGSGASSGNQGGQNAGGINMGLGNNQNSYRMNQQRLAFLDGPGSFDMGSGVIEEGTMVRQRQELIRLPDISRMLAEVKIPEARVRQIRQGMVAMVRVETLPGRSFKGKVRRVAPLPDAQSLWMNPDAKVYATDILIEEELPMLKPGVSARTEIIITNLMNVLSVPIQAVTTFDGDYVCFAKRGRKVTPVPVTTGLFNDQFIEVISGLQEGDRVLLAPVSDDDIFGTGAAPGDTNEAESE